MRRDRLLPFLVWLVTAALAAAAATLVYRAVIRPDPLAGRSDAAALYSDPALLFTDPGLLGSAIEEQVTEAVRACMARVGYDYRGPAVVAGLDTLLLPAADGYGIAAGAAVPAPRLGTGGPQGAGDSGYEAALYGTALAAAGEAPSGGCAAVGRAVLDQALAALDAMPYSLEQLESDASAHPAWVAALGQWSACMAERGYVAASPEELIAAQQAALAVAAGDDARALAAREREMAAADFACRASSLDVALQEVAADLAPAFVEQNRAQLAILIPPPGAGPASPASTAGVTGTSVLLGTGDVQVTLRWYSTVDLDLAVTDPYGDRIDYYTDGSPSGGRLDVDANYPCPTGTTTPVENVFWPPGGAPAGPYSVEVAYRDSCGTPAPQDFELVIRLDGEVAQDIHQTITYGRPLTFQFDYGRPG